MLGLQAAGYAGQLGGGDGAGDGDDGGAPDEAAAAKERAEAGGGEKEKEPHGGLRRGGSVLSIGRRSAAGIPGEASLGSVVSSPGAPAARPGAPSTYLSRSLGHAPPTVKTCTYAHNLTYAFDEASTSPRRRHVDIRLQASGSPRHHAPCSLVRTFIFPP